MDLQNKTTDSFDKFCKIMNSQETEIKKVILTKEEWEKEHTPDICLEGGAW